MTMTNNEYKNTSAGKQERLMNLMLELFDGEPVAMAQRFSALVLNTCDVDKAIQDYEKEVSFMKE